MLGLKKLCIWPCLKVTLICVSRTNVIFYFVCPPRCFMLVHIGLSLGHFLMRKIGIGQTALNNTPYNMWLKTVWKCSEFITLCICSCIKLHEILLPIFYPLELPSKLPFPHLEMAELYNSFKICYYREFKKRLWDAIQGQRVNTFR